MWEPEGKAAQCWSPWGRNHLCSCLLGTVGQTSEVGGTELLALPVGERGPGAWLPLLARCLMVSICSPDSFAFFMADVARGHPDRLWKDRR